MARVPNDPASTSTNPRIVLHCMTPDEWAEATGRGTIAPTSLRSEGFVHCSTAEQVGGVVSRFYAHLDEIVLAEVDLDVLADLAPASEVRWEAPAHPDGSPPGVDEAMVRFPHVYGPIPLEAVRSSAVCPTGVRAEPRN